MSNDQKQQPTALGQEAISTNGVLKRLGLSGQIFRTSEGTAFIETDVGLRRETMQVKGDAFRKFLKSKLYHETGKVPSQAKLRSIIDLLETYALQSGPVAEVHVRVAKDGNYVYIDLADDLGRAVEISRDGWRVIDSPPVHFLRTPSMQPLPVPRWGGTIGELRAFFDFVSDDDFVLAIAWLLGTYHSGPHPGLVISGEAGSGKSTLSERSIRGPSLFVACRKPKTSSTPARLIFGSTTMSLWCLQALQTLCAVIRPAGRRGQ